MPPKLTKMVTGLNLVYRNVDRIMGSKFGIVLWFSYDICPDIIQNLRGKYLRFGICVRYLPELILALLLR